jgi:hypothetical protein
VWFVDAATPDHGLWYPLRNPDLARADYYCEDVEAVIDIATAGEWRPVGAECSSPVRAASNLLARLGIIWGELDVA